MGEAFICHSPNLDGGASNAGALIRIPVFTGAEVTCTNGKKTYTKTSSGDYVEFNAGYGIWNISAKYNGTTFGTTSVNVTEFKIYEDNTFNTTSLIKVSAINGTKVTCDYNSNHYEKTVSNNLAEFIVGAGSWTIAATYNNSNASSDIIVVNDHSIHTLNIGVIKVNIPTGASVTCTAGTSNYTRASSNNTVSFCVAYNTWSIKSTLNGNESTKSIVVSEPKEYIINLAAINVTAIKNGTVSITGPINNTKTVTGTSVEFLVEYGNYSIKTYYNSNEMTSTGINVTESKIYTYNAGLSIIHVTVFPNATVTCVGPESYTKIATGVEYVEFIVTTGTWTLTSTVDGKSMEEVLNITTLQYYDIFLAGHTYGISINMANSDPTNAVTYIDDAVGFTPLSVNLSNGACNYGSWAEPIVDSFGCKPCLYANGTRNAYLNPNDYSKKENGTAADITSGAFDVMVEFKRTWYKYSMSGDTLTFQVADYDRSEDGFISTAFASLDDSGTIRDYMYFGAYEGYNNSNKIRSLSGKTPTGNISYTGYRSYAKANGAKYGMEDWCKRYYILGLLMLVTKSRGIQDKIGYGRIDVNSSSISTGTLNTAGLFAGYSDKTKAVKCFGIENMWGSLYQWCDGIVTMNSSSVGLKAYPPYNNAGTGYTTISDGFNRSSNLTPTKMRPVLNGAAIVAFVGQSDSTVGWCDTVCVNSGSGCVCVVGGDWDNYLSYSGPFLAYANYSPSDSNNYIGGRLLGA